MPKPLDKSVHDDVVNLYLAGEKLALIAVKHGINPTTVSRIAVAAGVGRTKSESQAVRATREAVGFERFGKKGAVQSKKNGKWFAADSSYEFVRMHQHDDDVEVIDWGRCEDRIQHRFGGACLFYVPDLRVVRSDGRIIIEEIKPSKMVLQAKNVAKFAAAIAFYGPIGIQFKVVTENEIGWSNIRSFDGVALYGVPDEERAAKRRAASLKVLHAMSPEKRAAYNLAAKERESKKRAQNRDAYNAQAREYRRLRNLSKAEKEDSQAGLF